MLEHCKTMTKELTSDQKARLYEGNVKLCRAVQAHPCIYDREQHAKKDAYEKAWEEIANICKDSVPSCKVRWRNIRTAFIRSRQVSGHKKRQPNRTRDYYLHDVLEFFIPYMTPNAVGDHSFEDTDDEVERSEAENNKSPKSDKSKSLSPVKKTQTMINDEERTNSAEETTQIEKCSPLSGKLKVNTFFIKEQPSKVGTFIIKKSVDKENPLEKDSNAVGLAGDIGVSAGGTEEANEEANKVSAEKLPHLPSEVISPPTDPVTVEVEEESRQFRFRRACKRNLDKTVVQQLRDNSPNPDVEPKRTRRNLSARRATIMSSAELKIATKSSSKNPPFAKNQEEQESNDKQPTEDNRNVLPNSTDPLLAIIPSDLVETQMQSSPVPEQDNVVEWRNPSPTLDQVDKEFPPKLVPFQVTHMPSSDTPKCDRSVQYDDDVQVSTFDDEFLNSLRPQMAAMNARQKLHFKQKVYKSLIEVFDDASTFPKPNEGRRQEPSLPRPEFSGVNNVTNEEMNLIRELVTLVQASKLSPEITSSLEKSIEELTPQKETTPTFSTQTPISATGVNQTGQKLINVQHPKAHQQHAADDNEPRHYLRKLITVSAPVSTPEGEKRRIYRILPKGASSNLSRISSSGVGTFIIPRAPGSIASSANAAAAAAAAAVAAPNSSAAPNVNQNSICRQRPISGGSMLLNTSCPNISVGNTSTHLRSTESTRNTSRVSSARRYSVCGSENISTMKDDKSPRIITTSANMPPSIPKLHFNNSNVRRYIRSSTATPPFKQPITPLTRNTPTPLNSFLGSGSHGEMSVASTLKDMTGFASLFSTNSPLPTTTVPVSSTPTIKVGVTKTTSATKTLTTNSISTRSTGKAGDKGTIPELEKTTQNGETGGKNKTSANTEITPETSGIIAPDNFSINIKSEPMD